MSVPTPPAPPRPCTVEVIEAGLFTTVQDSPGRLGYWMVGVPPSGAMDDRSLRLANRIVANSADAAGLECTVTGPTLRFTGPATIAVTGAPVPVTVDGRAAPMWSTLELVAGSIVSIGRVAGLGLRTYVAVRGGIDVAEVLGSRATFTLGGFGGHEGRVLEPGDVLATGSDVGPHVPSPLPPAAWPTFASDWTVAVREGPHAAPDFLTAEGFEAFFSATWVVQSHVARTGIRLDGPTPQWAREDGGEAGLHPSNIHDTGYAFGTVDLTGDTPVILGPDGPSLGGFTCPATVISSERWKLGQLAPGDRLRLVPVSGEEAEAGRASSLHVTRHLRAAGRGSGRVSSTTVRDGGVLDKVTGGPGRPDAVYRRSGDQFVLVELGEMTLDLGLRARIHALDEWLDANRPDAIVDATPGVRSMLVQFDPDVMRADEVVALLQKGDDELPPSDELEIPGRVVHLPLSWEDPSTLEAIRRYMSVVRDDAPWCPSNIEFIRRVNGLADHDEVRRTVFDARYLVVGLGDVYLGAPVATPLDPRHRLVTTKYNPARTWTPENAVGIGGAYLCIYGMEGPGGYQFVGRTVPVWYLGCDTPGAEPEVPWMLRNFDTLRFHPVSAEELLDLRARARTTGIDIEIEPTTFRLAEHRAFLADNAESITEFRTRQQAAFAEERARWRASGELR
ncbi:MAG: 5-oxoprolinase/urea amidolyase family protein [Actinomycetota bacterium]|nr:5-oxoprolinase/urea amidolyase family protein [Actinomycetota bacterium]